MNTDTFKFALAFGILLGVLLSLPTPQRECIIDYYDECIFTQYYKNVEEMVDLHFGNGYYQNVDKGFYRHFYKSFASESYKATNLLRTANNLYNQDRAHSYSLFKIWALYPISVINADLYYILARTSEGYCYSYAFSLCRV